jgi:hypothetical protein
MRQQHVRETQDLQQKQASLLSQVGTATGSTRRAIYTRSSRAMASRTRVRRLVWVVVFAYSRQARRFTWRGRTTKEEEEEDGTTTPRPSTIPRRQPSDQPYVHQHGSDEERIDGIVQRVLERMKSKRAGGGRRRRAPEPMVMDEDPDDKLEFLVSLALLDLSIRTHCATRP